MFYRHLSVDDFERFENAVGAIIDVFGRDHVFAADNLITMDRHLGFATDPDFQGAFKAESACLGDTTQMWRLHVLCWAAKHAAQLDGDFIECGVYEGFSSSVVARYLDFASLPKTYWLFDLFDHTDETSGMGMPAHGPALIGRVQRRFAHYPNVRVVPGMIPRIFEQGTPDRIAWFHLDLNDAGAETSALEALFDKMVPGGLLILDDYGWKSYGEQKAAADLFAQSRNHFILELPTGQGLLIKR